MASSFLCALSFLTCLLFFTSPFQISSVNSVPLPSGSSEKVPFSLYYRSLDSGSALFISQDLPWIFENGLISIVDLHLSPWGNSKILNNETFVCQGGERECYLNTIQACAINVWPDVVKHFNFIKCIESRRYFEEKSVESVLSNDDFSKWETCYDSLKLDRTPIDECYKSGLGKELERKYAEETDALIPPPIFTPWIVVAGKPIFTDVSNFMSYICRAYKGSSPPEACKYHPIITSQSDKPKKIHVSYRAKLQSFLD